MKYIKKHILDTVDAWQFTKMNFRSGIPQELNSENLSLWSQHGGQVIGGELKLPQGSVVVYEDDWIVKSCNGDIQLYKSEDFDELYAEYGMETNKSKLLSATEIIIVSFILVISAMIPSIYIIYNTIDRVEAICENDGLIQFDDKVYRCSLVNQHNQ